MNRKIVITGIGWVTPLGQSVEEVWQALLDGRSGIGPIAGQGTDPNLPLIYQSQTQCGVIHP